MTKVDCQPEPFASVPLLNIDPETGKVPSARVRNPKTVRDIYRRAVEDDKINAANRADTQAMLDGEPPYDESQLEAAGCGDMTNLNWRGAEKQLDRAMNPYYRMIQSEDELVSVHTLYGAEEDRAGWDTILNEEITRAYRTSDWFYFQSARIIQKYVWDGLGIGHFRDKLDWRYRAAGLGQFYFPRQSFLDESEHEVICSIDEFSVAGRSSLYDKIKNARPDQPDYHGWNVAAVKGAIKKATAAVPAFQDWERLTDEIKNNDLSVSNQVAKVRCVHCFVQEFDGTVSHYIITEDCYTKSEQEENFLYVCRGKYRSIREILVMFSYGLGTNTKTHGQRGLGYKIYPTEQQFNRSMCRAVDASMLASSLMLKSSDENGYQGAGYQTIGPCSILDPEFELVQFSPPDLQDAVMPVINEMRMMQNERTAGYSPEGVFDGDQRKTKYEISAALEQNAALTDVEQEFFYQPFERLMRESIRRMSNRKLRADDPGGREVHDLIKRLVKRGVPAEAFYRIDINSVQVIRAIGGGSAAARTLKLDRLGAKYERMDDVGRANYDWDTAVDDVGSAAASRYFPKNGVKRTTVDTQIAINQNFILTNGGVCPVLPADKHLAHAREHIKPLVEMFEQYELGQIEMAEAATTYAALYEHTVEHVVEAEGDPATMSEVAALNQMLQRVGEVISNGLKEAEDNARDAAEEGAAAQDPGAGIEAQAKVDEARQKLDMQREQNEAKIRMMQEQSDTKRAIADAEAAAKIQRERRLAEVKAETAKKVAASKPLAKKAAKKAAKKPDK